MRKMDAGEAPPTREDESAKINNGRAFFAEPDRLGEYLLVDYVSNKKKLQRA